LLPASHSQFHGKILVALQSLFGCPSRPKAGSKGDRGMKARRLNPRPHQQPLEIFAARIILDKNSPVRFHKLMIKAVIKKVTRSRSTLLASGGR
jgi:hypothetical protein